MLISRNLTTFHCNVAYVNKVMIMTMMMMMMDGDDDDDDDN